MEKERIGKNIVIGVLLVTVLCMSAAFAALSTFSLNVNGVATLPDARWDVGFTDVQLTDDSTIDVEPEFSINSIEYTIDLVEGATYEFDATITNNGTYDAKLNNLEINNTIPTALTDLIKYEATGITEGETITANGGTKTLHIKVTMGTISTDTLLEAVQATSSISFTVLAEYVQA